MRSHTLPIYGMHCRSCEVLLEDEISEVPGVRRVDVNQKKGTAEIHYRGDLDLAQVEGKVLSAGYKLEQDDPLPLLCQDKEVYNQVARAFVILLALYMIGKWLGIFDLSTSVSSNYSSLPVVFLVGLTAGVSTCMALVGGLVLGTSARFAKQKPLASTTEKFIPHLTFNIGRVVAFFILGGLIGWVGSVMQLSMSAVGFLTILVGLSMLLIGAQLIDIFPRLSGWQLTLPKGISRFLGMDSYKQAEYSHKNSAIMGALTFFLPCGFTQAMQLYAMSTGSATTGALTMATFALGTAPGLLGIGGLTSVVKGKKADLFFKAAGLAVIAFAFFNISNGLNLTGLKVSASNMLAKSEPQTVLGETSDAQVVNATYAKGYMSPEEIVVSVGQPTKLVIDVQDNGRGCMSGVAIPGLTKQKARLIKGQPITFEFTPQKKGSYPLVCTSMGMYHGSSIVVQ